MKKGNVITWLFGDHLGSTSKTYVNGAGAATEQRYYPWGATRYGSSPTAFQYTGQRNDSSIGLYFYGARYYDPSLGRFIQADTIVPNFTDPQSLNRYSYTLNNPLRYVDPTGHFTDVEWKENLGLSDDQFTAWWASLPNELQTALSGLEWGDILEFTYDKGVARFMLINTSFGDVKHRYNTSMLTSSAIATIFYDSRVGFWDIDNAESMDFLTGLSVMPISTVGVVNLGDSRHPAKGAIPYIQGQDAYIYSDGEYRRGEIIGCKWELAVALFTVPKLLGPWAGAAGDVMGTALAGGEIFDFLQDNADMITGAVDSTNYRNNQPIPYLHNGTLENTLRWSNLRLSSITN